MTVIVEEIITNAVKQERPVNSEEFKLLKNFLSNAEQRIRVTQDLTASTDEIIRRASQRLFQKYPSTILKGGNAYGENRTAACIRDLEFHVRYVTYAVLTDNPSVLNNFLSGLIETYQALGTSIVEMSEGVRLLKEESFSLILSEDMTLVAPYFDYILDYYKSGRLDTTKILLNESKKVASIGAGIERRGDRLIAMTAGGAFLGGVLAQAPGAIIGASTGAMFALLARVKQSI